MSLLRILGIRSSSVRKHGVIARIARMQTADAMSYFVVLFEGQVFPLRLRTQGSRDMEERLALSQAGDHIELTLSGPVTRDGWCDVVDVVNDALDASIAVTIARNAGIGYAG